MHIYLKIISDNYGTNMNYQTCNLYSHHILFYVIQITQSHINTVYPQEISETEAFVMKISRHRSIADGLQ